MSVTEASEAEQKETTKGSVKKDVVIGVPPFTNTADKEIFISDLFPNSPSINRRAGNRGTFFSSLAHYQLIVMDLIWSTRNGDGGDLNLKQLIAQIPITLGFTLISLVNIVFGAFYYKHLALSPLRLFPPYLDLYRAVFFPLLPWIPGSVDDGNGAFHVLLWNVHCLLLGQIPFLIMTLYWERLWGSKPLLIYLAVVCGSVCAISTGHVILGYMVSFRYSVVQSFFSGPFAHNAAYLVAYKQWNPEQLFMSSIRIKWVPLVYLGYSLLSSLILPVPSTLSSYPLLMQFSLAVTGFYFGWVYLRFYDSRGVLSVQTGAANQPEESDSMMPASVGKRKKRGDRSDAFAFDTFFPPFLEPYIKSISRVIVRIGNQIGLVPKESVESREARKTGKVQVDHNNNISDQERRKAIALKALDAHLQKQ